MGTLWLVCMQSTNTCLHSINNVRLETDLHSRILIGLAQVLADSRSNASTVEIDKFVSKSPTVPLDNPDDATIFKRGDIPSVGTMVKGRHGKLQNT